MKDIMILRVFPKKTSYSPDDPFAFFGPPPMPQLIPEHDEVQRGGWIEISGLSAIFPQRMCGKPSGKSRFLAITAGRKARHSGAAL